MAILGTLLIDTQRSSRRTGDPKAAADLRETGKQYLEQVLKTDVRRVAITHQGLQVR